MRQFTGILLLIPVVLAGCARYQYVTVLSDLPANERKEYLIENDSLSISYNFSGLGGPVRITVRNKLDIPLYIDWKRSALILNDESNTYFQDRSELSGISEGYTINWSPLMSTTTASVEGEIRRDESVGFIAPKSQKRSEMISIDGQFFDLKGRRRAEAIKVRTSSGFCQGH